MPLLRERLEQPNKQPNSFPASTGQDSCRRAVRIVDIDQHEAAATALKQASVIKTMTLMSFALKKGTMKVISVPESAKRKLKQAA